MKTLSAGIRLALIVSVACQAGSCADSPRRQEPPPQPGVADRLVEPAVRFGKLQAGGSEADLVAAYGSGNVRRVDVHLGEGETAPGSLVFPDDPQSRFEVIWRDSTFRRSPSRVVVRGDRSVWSLPRGITLGTSLIELEERNGRAFTLAGFGWDYAGAVISWNGGELDSLLPGVRLYLQPRTEDRAGPSYTRALGDRGFPSSHEAMRALNPRVYQIFVELTPSGEGTPSATNGGSP